MGALRIERIDATRARVSGCLGFHEAAAAADRWRELATDGSAEIVADVGALESVDSATLAVLLEWAARMQASGRRLRLVAAPAELSALARLCAAEGLLGLS
ncbi:lipid asymmetry maintenance protein MlaB [Dokdonella sp.]|uniref:STAS domain-containing protein n=1 Tax=Dokdonella sp. TaxID=2291710 RepID=UPI003782E945